MLGSANSKNSNVPTNAATQAPPKTPAQRLTKEELKESAKKLICDNDELKKVIKGRCDSIYVGNKAKDLNDRYSVISKEIPDDLLEILEHSTQFGTWCVTCTEESKKDFLAKLNKKLKDMDASEFKGHPHRVLKSNNRELRKNNLTIFIKEYFQSELIGIGKNVARLNHDDKADAPSISKEKMAAAKSKAEKDAKDAARNVRIQCREFVSKETIVTALKHHRSENLELKALNKDAGATIDALYNSAIEQLSLCPEFQSCQDILDRNDKRLFSTKFEEYLKSMDVAVFHQASQKRKDFLSSFFRKHFGAKFIDEKMISLFTKEFQGNVGKIFAQAQANGTSVNGKFKSVFEHSPEKNESSKEFIRRILVTVYNETIIEEEKQQIEVAAKLMVEKFVANSHIVNKWIEELVELAGMQHKSTYRMVLESVLDKISKARISDNKLLIDIEMFEGLASVLESVYDRSWVNANDLLTILDLIDKIRANNQVDVLPFLKVYTRLLNAMVDINVTGINYKEIYKVLEKYFSDFVNDKDLDIKFYSQYARRALLRIPHDTSTMKILFDHGVTLGSAVVSLAGAVKGLDTNKLRDAIKSFGEFASAVSYGASYIKEVINGAQDVKKEVSEAISSIRSIKDAQHVWYELLRFSEMLLKANCFYAWKIYFIENILPLQHDLLFYGIILQLDEVIHKNHDNAHAGTATEVMRFLQAIFENGGFDEENAINKTAKLIQAKKSTSQNADVKSIADNIIEKWLKEPNQSLPINQLRKKAFQTNVVNAKHDAVNKEPQLSAASDSLFLEIKKAAEAHPIFKGQVGSFLVMLLMESYINDYYISNPFNKKSKIKPQPVQFSHLADKKKPNESKDKKSHQAESSATKDISSGELFKSLFDAKHIQQKKLRCLITGKPGVGKTNFSRLYGYEWAQGKMGKGDSTSHPSQHFSCVLSISLKSFAQNVMSKSNYTLARVIFSELLLLRMDANTRESIMSNHGEKTVSDILKQQEKILIILDGFDEVAHLYAQEKTVSVAIDDIITGFPFVIVTSRTSAGLDRSKFDLEYEMKGFTKEARNNLVEEYFSAKDNSSNRRTLLDRLNKNPSLQQISLIPYNLILLCTVWEKLSKKANFNSAYLYEEFLLHLLVRQLEKEGATGELTNLFRASKKGYLFDTRYKHELAYLQAIAFNALIYGSTVIIRELLRKTQLSIFKSKAFDYKAFNRALNLGLTSSDYKDDVKNTEVIQTNNNFNHWSLGEYLSARYFISILPQITSKKARESNQNLRNAYDSLFGSYSNYASLFFFFVAGELSNLRINSLPGSKEEGLTVLFWRELLNQHDTLKMPNWHLLITCLEETRLDARFLTLFPNIKKYVHEMFFKVINNYLEFSIGESFPWHSIFIACPSVMYHFEIIHNIFDLYEVSPNQVYKKFIRQFDYNVIPDLAIKWNLVRKIQSFEKRELNLLLIERGIGKNDRDEYLKTYSPKKEQHKATSNTLNSIDAAGISTTQADQKQIFVSASLGSSKTNVDPTQETSGLIDEKSIAEVVSRIKNYSKDSSVNPVYLKETLTLFDKTTAAYFLSERETEADDLMVAGALVELGSLLDNKAVDNKIVDIYKPFLSKWLASSKGDAIRYMILVILIESSRKVANFQMMLGDKELENALISAFSFHRIIKEYDGHLKNIYWQPVSHYICSDFLIKNEENKKNLEAIFNAILQEVSSYIDKVLEQHNPAEFGAVFLVLRNMLDVPNDPAVEWLAGLIISNPKILKLLQDDLTFVFNNSADDRIEKTRERIFDLYNELFIKILKVVPNDKNILSAFIKTQLMLVDKNKNLLSDFGDLFELLTLNISEEFVQSILGIIFQKINTISKLGPNQQSSIYRNCLWLVRHNAHDVRKKYLEATSEQIDKMDDAGKKFVAAFIYGIQPHYLFEFISNSKNGGAWMKKLTENLPENFWFNYIIYHNMQLHVYQHENENKKLKMYCNSLQGTYVITHEQHENFVVPIQNKVKTFATILAGDPFVVSTYDEKFSDSVVLDFIPGLISKPKIIVDSFLDEPETHSKVLSKNTKKSHNVGMQFLQDPRQASQRGWNCFDLAIGLDVALKIDEKDASKRAQATRAKLVDFALDEKNIPEFRRLLAPEIRHAAGLTAVYLNLQKEKETAEKERNTRLAELFGVAEVLEKARTSEASTQAMVSEQIVKLLADDDRSKQDADVSGLEHHILPRSLQTEALLKLMNDYQNADEVMQKVIRDCLQNPQMQEAVAACKKALSQAQGNRVINIVAAEDLYVFLKAPEQQKLYPNAWEMYSKQYDEKFVPHEKALQAYCEDEKTYRTYISEYYGKNGWVAFQRSFKAEGVSTSMIDIAARLVNAQIVVCQQGAILQNNWEEIYCTAPFTAQNNKKVYVQFIGRSHFIALQENPDYAKNWVSHLQQSEIFNVTIDAGKIDKNAPTSLPLTSAKARVEKTNEIAALIIHSFIFHKPNASNTTTTEDKNNSAKNEEKSPNFSSDQSRMNFGHLI